MPALTTITFTARRSPASTPATLPGARAVLVAGLLLAVAVAALAAGQAVPHTAEPALALLLKFLGVIKLATAAAAAGLVAWRLAAPLARPLAAVAIAACWCLAAGAVLITGLAYLLPALALFHAGLFALLLAAVSEAREKPPTPTQSSPAASS